MKLLSIFLMALLCLGACSKKADDKPQGVLTDTQKRALEQAKGVEDTLKKAEEERKKALEEQEQ